MRKMRYKLAPGSQVREEDFGLLFYTMYGPRLYFLSSGDWIGCEFFQGILTLEQWLSQHNAAKSMSEATMVEMRAGLDQLKKKGVILEC